MLKKLYDIVIVFKEYLLFALFGSIFYLLGAALLYGAFGTLDIALLAGRMRPLPAVTAAAALIP